MKPFLTPGGWQESKCVYWKVSVGLKCVRTSRIECFLNRSPLYTHVPKNIISVSEISAVNFIVGWKLFATSLKLFTASLFLFPSKKMSLLSVSLGTIVLLMQNLGGRTKSIMVFSEMAYRKLASIECFVCSTYNFDSFLLRDV